MDRLYKLIKDGLVFGGVALVSLCVGAAFDEYREDSIGWVYVSPAERLLSQEQQENELSVAISTNVNVRKEVVVLTLQDMEHKVQSGEVIIFDVRPNLFFEMSHIPGARSFPKKDFDHSFAQNKSVIEEAIKSGKEIVFYCAGPHCPDASKAVSILLKKGYGNLSIFEGGMEQWEQKGLSTESDI